MITLDGLLREKIREKLLKMSHKKCMKNCSKERYDILLAKVKYVYQHGNGRMCI